MQTQGKVASLACNFNLVNIWANKTFSYFFILVIMIMITQQAVTFFSCVQQSWNAENIDNSITFNLIINLFLSIDEQVAQSQGIVEVQFGPFSLDKNFQSLEVDVHSFQVLLATSMFFSGPSYNQHLKESSVFIQNFQLHFFRFFSLHLKFKDNRAA